MNIGVVGGVQRKEPKLAQVAAERGYGFEFHGGHVDGRGALALAALVERAGFVVIAMEVNSHGAVQMTKKLCQRLGRPYVVTRSCSPSRFAQLLADLARERGLAVGA
jgi:hypothetical protein